MHSVLGEHLGYVSDPIRMEAYRRAIFQIIKPDMTVADLGCGTGVLGLLCLEAGARSVYEIDHSSMLGLARESFSRAGRLESAVFYHDHSARVELPAQVDVVVCDQVGYLGVDAGIASDLGDARRRFLKPGGHLIPRALRIAVAGVEAPLAFDAVEAWSRESVPAELRWLREQAEQVRYPAHFLPEHLVTEPHELGSVLLDADHSVLFSWSREIDVARDGHIHGLAAWFECELAEGVWMTNSPVAPWAIQRPQGFLPLKRPARVHKGQRLRVSIMARPDGGLIAWTVHLPSGESVRHSTWRGDAATMRDVIKSSPDTVPSLNRSGRARAVVLSYIDGLKTVAEIRTALAREHPALFPSLAEADRFLAHVLEKDTE